MRKGRIFWRRVLAQSARKKVNMAKHKNHNFRDYHDSMTLATLMAVSLQLNGMPMMWKIQQAMQDDAIRSRQSSPRFHPGNRAEVFVWQNFQPAYRDPGWKNRHLGNWASPSLLAEASFPWHLPAKYQGKEDSTNRESQPALSCEHRKFYNGFRGKVKSRKPGSCEEALKRFTMSPGGGRGGVGRRTNADLSNFFFKPTEECRTSDWQRKSSMKSSFLFTPTLQPCYHGERKRPWETGVELNWPIRDIACSRRSDCGERVKSYAANANRNMRGKNEGRLWLCFFLSSIFRPRPTNLLPAPHHRSE